MKTIVSRAGKGTKVILTGDPQQIDSPYLDSNSNGLTYLVERSKSYPHAGIMHVNGIVRSRLAAFAEENL